MERSEYIARLIGPVMLIIGIGMIGGMLTEINITSPTGVRQASRLDNKNVSAPILDCFERMARAIRK